MKRLISDLWNGEPTFVLGLIRAILVVGVLLVANVPAPVAAGLYGIIEAATTYYNRSKVSPSS